MTEAALRRDTDRFYALLDELASAVGGPRTFGDCTADSGWPQLGVYFFFEPRQIRSDNAGHRVVRVGSHALTATSKATLWSRLAQHRGPLTGPNAGGGNHRGSIFRQHIGTALLATGDWPADVAQSWRHQKATPRQRQAERPLERAVTTHLSTMSLLWLDVPDREHRKTLRADSIALLSHHDGALNPPTPSWLGLHAANDNVRACGLWNSNYVGDPYDPAFLDIMEARIKAMLQPT